MIKLTMPDFLRGYISQHPRTTLEEADAIWRERGGESPLDPTLFWEAKRAWRIAEDRSLVRGSSAD